jgi:hypothetical protein
MKIKYLLLLLLILPVLNGCKKDDNDYRKKIIGCWKASGFLAPLSNPHKLLNFKQNGYIDFYLK